MHQLVSSYIEGTIFKLYRASGLPFTDRLSREDKESIVTKLAKYLYQIYQQNISTYEEDIIARYSSYRDVAIEITTISGSIGDIRYLIIKSRNSRLLPRQTLVFSGTKESTLLLNRVTSKSDVNDYLLKLLQLQTDSVYAEYDEVPSKVIPLVINKLSLNFNNLRLVYGIHQSSGLLKTIELEVPHADLNTLRQQNGDLYTNICQFMYNCSKIHFNKLKVKRLTSDVINISSDGRIKFNRMSNDNDSDEKMADEDGGALLILKLFHLALNEV
ncbi:hypothetical protein I9W82_001459 [Candida metapsilosis]|uniref:Uncharacterized protein n=1 Tax=Candida metapsilosis TaxID=273372 RepID=A0A8H7ZK54_9ASCO|nr:hypothetical protein I9W82_001459 [Candida metapsilosis]